MRQIVSLMLLLGGLSVGCSDADESDPSLRAAQQTKETSDDSGTSTDDGSIPCAPTDATAGATIEPKSGNTTLSGTISFVKGASGVKAVLKVEGAPPGLHGAHIHEKGDCSADDGTSAGGHWNPAMASHGAPSETAHYGDLGNITIGEDGTGELELEKSVWSIGDGAEGDVVGKAIIIHASPDDFMTQPTGNAGGRIGCGVIALD